ncbi:MAG: cysteine desulfurase-like protein [Eubacteriales bacterium]
MEKFKFEIDYVREQFPCLSKTVNGFPAAFLDGPGGTQVPRRVVEKINEYLYYHNANSHGSYVTSQESDKLYWKSREAIADLLNCAPEEVAFGANSTSNNFKLSYSLLRSGIIKAGDEVLITDIDHEGNRSPWRTLQDFGVIVKSVAVDPKTCTLIMDDFKNKLSSKTKLLAINWAANACGTITDVKEYVRLAHAVGALTVVDGVHYVPHKPVDVKDIDTDFLICSVYKFCGPHLGVLYVKKEVGEKIKTIRVLADDNTEMPWKFETGTPAMELACGATETIEFLADIGRKHEAYFGEQLRGLEGRRRALVAGMLAIDEYEDSLANALRNELQKIPGLKIYGPGNEHPRTPTVSFTIDGSNAADIAEYLGSKGLFVWDGDFYAIQIINHVLQLTEQGGLVRVGFAPYNTINEVERTIQAVNDFISTKK